ncbi:(2Fe-2S) ferredoxin domain-containing protein [Roseibium sp. LAB1]
MRPTILLLAKAAIAAKPLAELEALAQSVSAAMPGFQTVYALSEQGSPSLRQRLDDLAGQSVPEVVIVPVMIPMEPGFPAWIKRSVHRWKQNRQGFLPAIRIADAPATRSEELTQLLTGLATNTAAGNVLEETVKLPDASIIPGQKHRILVCMGGACNDAGAVSLWSHLRTEQDRLKLRDAGDGMMSCKTSCLGPCNLAPVLQVWPDGTTYCGVDEAGVDTILKTHVLESGGPAAEFAYPADGNKQRLRQRASAGT